MHIIIAILNFCRESRFQDLMMNSDLLSESDSEQLGCWQRKTSKLLCYMCDKGKIKYINPIN